MSKFLNDNFDENVREEERIAVFYFSPINHKLVLRMLAFTL